MNAHTDVIEGVARPLAIREEALPVGSEPLYFQAMRPAEKIAFAREIADALIPIIRAKNLSKRLNKKNPDDEYVELEAWQTCGFMCGMSAKVDWTKPVPNGYHARAIVIRMDTGVEIGAGENVCTRDEYNWKQRDDYAVLGMAQTRAQSRALRGVLAWILVLAGYKPTPQEEMPPEGVSGEPPKQKPKPSNDNDAKRKHDRIKLAEVCTQRNITDEQYREAMAFLFGDDCFDASGKPSSTMLDPKQRGKLYRYLLEMEIPE